MRRGLYTVAVGSSIVAIVLGLMYRAARFGFVTPLTPIASAVGLALIFVNGSVLIWRALQKSSDLAWVRSYSFVWLVTLALVAAVGRFAVEVESSPAVGIAILGLGLFAVVLFAWMRSASILSGLTLILGSGLFGTWAGGVVWGRIYKSPLFTEMLIAGGIVHHDGVTLAALGNMLRTYHVASVGLDGLPYMAYHWGTPWLFAQLSNLTSQSVLEFYQLGFPVTMIPLFFGGVIAFAVQLSETDITRSRATWIIFVAATIGVIPISGADALGVWTSNLMISESYTVGIPVALMLLATTVVFWRERGNAVLAGNAQVSDVAFLAIILAAGLVVLGYLKISLMILGFGAAGYAALRVGALKRWPLLLIGLWITGLVVVTYQRTSLVAHREGVVPFDFMRSFVPRAWWAFFVFAQLFWSLAYVVLRLRREQARTIGDVIALFRERRILDVEVVAAVAIAGILPGFILHIDGGSAFYFADVQRWLSVGLILAGGTALLGFAESRRLSNLQRWALGFVLLPFVVSTARNSVHWTTRMLRANVDLRRSLYPEGEAKRIPPRISSIPRLGNPLKLEAGLRRSQNFNQVASLLQLAQAPLDFKQNTAVFVPQSELKYWTMLKRPNGCAFSGFVVPALTGMATIDGMPAASCKLSPYYGLSLFEKRSSPQTALDTDVSAVCRRARSKGFSRVIVLRFDPEGRAMQRVTECAPPA